MPASSSNSAFMPGCSAIALTIARIRNGSSVSFGRSGALLLVERGAQILQRGDVDLLDIGDVRDARFGQRHLFRDLAAQPDDLDVLDRSVRRQARRPCGLRPAREEGLDILMRDAAGRPAAGDLAQIDAGLPGAQAHRRRRQRPLAFGARRAG